MRKKILSFVIATTLAITMCVIPTTVKAETLGGKADSGNEGEVIDGSSGNSTEIGTSNIDVQAKETGNAHEIVYSVTVTWGTMQFEYYYGPTWDPGSHSYKGASGEGWKDSYVDGSNNRIKVVNDSNWPVDVEVSFDLAPARFNVHPDRETSVKGRFDYDNDDLKNNLTDSNVDNCGYGRLSFFLNSSDSLNQYFDSDTLLDSGGTKLTTSKVLYFTLWGTPDKANAKSDFTKAGTIKVMVKPYTT